MPLDIITALVILAITTGVSYLLRPKPEGAKPAAATELELPTCEVGTPYGVVFGTPARFKSAMVLWYGNFRTHRIKEEGVEIGHWYMVTVHFGLCHGNVDGVLQVWMEDTCVWPTCQDSSVYASDGETLIHINRNPGLEIWGGEKRGGGVAGKMNVLYGSDSQMADPRLSALLSDNLGVGEVMPTFRGITSIVCYHDTVGFENYGFIWGKSPRLSVPQWVLRRRSKLHDGSSQWYTAKANVGTYELNIVHVLRELMTSKTIGCGLSTLVINETSWQAAADTCYDENIGISYYYLPRGGDVTELIKKLERIMDGVIYFDHAVGEYKIHMARDDYNPDDLTEYDEDDFDIEEFHRPVYGKVPSETIIRYTERDSAQRATASSRDRAMAEVQGSVPMVQMFDYPMIHDADLANRIAARDQRHTSLLPAALVLSCKRTMYNVYRGDVFKISHPKLEADGISGMIVRLLRVNGGKLEDGRITMEVSQDVYKFGETIYATPPTTNWTKPTEEEDEGLQETVTVTMNEWTIRTLNETVS